MLKFVPRSTAPAEECLTGVPSWMASLLVARGITTNEAAKAFLFPDMQQLHDPMLLSDMSEAVRILRAAAKAGKRCVVYGDYDVDGVCAAVIAQEALLSIGLNTAVYIPDRHEEGYGLNESAIRALAGQAELLLTVDCGITGNEHVQLAKELGMQVIVTDHHRPADELPPADAVINPLLADYPFPSLCGAGVAYKLACALLGEESCQPLLDLCALATIADMVPLTGENRVLAHFGLMELNRTQREGLLALKQVAGLKGEVDAEGVGFGLAPRMNASGRLGTAMLALELLQEENKEEALRIALELDAVNTQRRTEEQQTVEEALEQLQQEDLVSTRVIVLMGESWNSGVVGLAAGRIAEKYAYPTVILTKVQDNYVGSARSACGVDIHAALAECADLFIRFGGHKQAAGLTMPCENLLAFKRRLSDAVRAQLPDDSLVPSLPYDGEMSLSDVTPDTIARLKLLAPYGMGNPAPQFLFTGVSPLVLRPVGANGKHLKCSLMQNGQMRGGISFGKGDMADKLPGEVRMVATPMLNEFMGKTSAECRVLALQLQPETLKEDKITEMEAVLQDICILDENNIRLPVPVVEDAFLDSLTLEKQGTLLLCRTRETALRMQQRYWDLDFAVGDISDPRAYSTVLWAACSAGVQSPYRTVVLCDGNLGDFEGALWRKNSPQAMVYALPVSDALRELRQELAPTKPLLRNLYRLLTRKGYYALTTLSMDAGMPEVQTLCSLMILEQIELIRFTTTPFLVTVLPMQRRDPEESALYQRLHC